MSMEARGEGRDRAAGFTLLELLVAMTVLGFLAVLMFGTLRFGFQAWQRGTTVMAESDDIRVTQTVLRRLIAAAHPLRIADDATRAHVDFSGSEDRLTWLAPMPDALESGGFGRYDVFVKERQGRRELEIAWRPELVRDGDPAAAPNEMPLVTGIDGVEIAYFGALEPRQLPSWQSTWTDQATLPALIRLHVQFPKGDRRLWPDLVVEPRIAVDASCIYDPVSRDCRYR